MENCAPTFSREIALTVSARGHAGRVARRMMNSCTGMLNIRHDLAGPPIIQRLCCVGPPLVSPTPRRTRLPGSQAMSHLSDHGPAKDSQPGRRRRDDVASTVVQRSSTANGHAPKDAGPRTCRRRNRNLGRRCERRTHDRRKVTA